ncbi:MAG: Rrf2 family transcriptional regulator [Oscillospiraceae bacterium]|nr:Rrf2 family transcriptional regulator [Oscillospiraceae bacterium]
MRISSRCSLALHCLLLIAEYGERRKITSEKLAASTGCNAATARGMMLALKKAGIISVTRGVGGAHLLREPGEITVWDVFRAVEPDGLDKLIGIHPKPSEICPVGKRIEAVLTETYVGIEDAVQRSMQEITLADVQERFHELRRRQRAAAGEGAPQQA